MLHIKATRNDNDFFEELKNQYPDITIVKSMNIDGNSELIEVFIELTPVILSSITLIIHEILNYMKSKRKDEKKEQSEITIEKKGKKGGYKVLIKTSDINNIDTALNKIIKQIKKL